MKDVENVLPFLFGKGKRGSFFRRVLQGFRALVCQPPVKRGSWEAKQVTSFFLAEYRDKRLDCLHDDFSVLGLVLGPSKTQSFFWISITVLALSSSS